MKRTNVVLTAFLVACAAGVASAQNAPAKVGSRPAIKAQPAKRTQASNTYGTDVLSYYRMGAAEFTGIDVPGTDDWSDTFYSDGVSFRRYGTIANAYFIGTPHLQSGAIIYRIDVHDCVNVDGSVHGDIQTCDAVGGSCTILASINTIAGCGFDPVDMPPGGYVVDNSPFGNLLVIRIVTAATDGSDSFAGVTVEYKLQVSPAPGSATFPDVPPSDFGFQYVEALVASGITGGCGSGLYCPNSPVTRRQMAIFIAKALGLHFP
jgi:hypothetical protein